MGIKRKKPIVVCVDNVGAIFMSENVNVDSRHHYIREIVEDGFIKITFVKSKENKSDIFTKNVGQDIYLLHVVNYIFDKKKIYVDWNIEGRVLVILERVNSISQSTDGVCH